MMDYDLSITFEGGVEKIFRDSDIIEYKDVVEDNELVIKYRIKGLDEQIGTRADVKVCHINKSKILFMEEIRSIPIIKEEEG